MSMAVSRFLHSFNFRSLFPISTTNSKRMALRVSRCLWLLSCVVCVFFVVYMMRLVLIRFWDSPIITTVDTTNHPIRDVPFPSVTLCNANKVYAPHTDNITRNLLIRGVPEEKILKYYAMLPNLINPEFYNEDFVNISKIMGELGYNAESLMLEVFQPCEKLLIMCSWKGEECPCEDLFKISRSSEGLCCSFNYNALKMSLEE